jgi:hypothetical protein
VQNRIFGVPQLSNPVIFVPQLFWMVVFAWRCHNWVYKVPQLSNMFIFCPSTIKSIYFSLDYFGRWHSHDAALGQHAKYMWRWDPCHVAVFFPFLILPSLSLTLLSLYLLIHIQKDGALGSSIPTAASSCGGERWEKLRQAPVMEHAERYSTMGSCAERLVWYSKRREKGGSYKARGTHHHMYLACETHHHIMRKSPSKTRGT